MDLGISKRVALVAAASRGLGKAVAMRLAQEGAIVAICARNAENITRAGDDIVRQTGAQVISAACDVTDPAQIKAFIKDIVEATGRLDILVTNAGGPPAGMHDDFAPEDYRKGVELNLMSTIDMCYQVLPLMKKQQWGRIVAITSVAARQPISNLILSNTARAGVLGFIKTLSSQVATEGITVNSICPGYTKTERIEELAQMFAESGKGSIEDFYQKIEVDVPMQRMGSPEEFANAVTFLASEAASYITGVALPVDGGWIKGLY